MGQRREREGGGGVRGKGEGREGRKSMKGKGGGGGKLGGEEGGQELPPERGVTGFQDRETMNGSFSLLSWGSLQLKGRFLVKLQVSAQLSLEGDTCQSLQF